MAHILRHRGVQLIGGGWSFFIAENLVLSHNRDALIEAIGDGGYHGIYNTLSTCACASIAYGYIRHGRGKGPRIFCPTTPAARAGALILQSCGLVGFSQLAPRLQVPVTWSGAAEKKPSKWNAAATTAGEAAEAKAASASSSALRARCPMDFTPADVPPDGIYGLKRVSRHPTFWSLGFLGLGSALASPFAAEVVMFSMPAVLAVIGGSHQDYRFRRNSGGSLPPEVDAVTCNIPFVALVSGHQSWQALYDELKWTNAGLAITLGGLLALRRFRAPPR
eukprot:TRINITY_DN11609_c0_g1_i1.p1 TRINITY_DN11609_c0_g1~~TRINITY_DN11609_c0_g1_i1.p1  ORF type:complete len:278 (-),score=46.51 TRINITY_DN11609_c0_g1_i1:16-849(-)